MPTAAKNLLVPRPDVVQGGVAEKQACNTAVELGGLILFFFQERTDCAGLLSRDPRFQESDGIAMQWHNLLGLHREGRGGGLDRGGINWQRFHRRNAEEEVCDSPMNE